MTMVLVRCRKPDATDLLRDSGLHTLPAAVRIDVLAFDAGDFIRLDEQECIALVVRRGGRQLRFGPELEPEALCSCGRGQGGGRDEQPADRAGHRKGGIERRIARMPEVYGLTW